MYENIPWFWSCDRKRHLTKIEDGGDLIWDFIKVLFYAVHGQILIKFGMLLQNDNLKYIAW